MKRLRWRPYWSAFRLRALMESQYRSAALGGMVTQLFFALVLVSLYQALYAGRNPAELRDTISYVWLQQMLFRSLMARDTELHEQIMTGSVAYTLCRPMDLHTYTVCSQLARQTVGALMRLTPMLLAMPLVPQSMRISAPESPLAMGQFLVSTALGQVCIAEIGTVIDAVVMKTLDNRGASAALRLTMVALSGNIVPLTLFPDSVQLLVRYQPFAQAMDAPIRMYLHAQGMAEWSISVAVQAGYALAAALLARALWARRLTDMTVQGG